MSIVNPISTTDAAESLGISEQRVRQLCLENGIGILLNRRARILQPKDIEKLRVLLSRTKPCGWPRGVARKKT